MMGTAGNSLLTNKESKLIEILKKYDGAVLAFSGGSDSSMLVYALKKSGVRFKCVTFDTALYPPYQLEDSKKLAKDLGFLHQIIQIDQLAIKGLRQNPLDRCYICKKEMFSRLFSVDILDNFNFVLDGSNADDVNYFRPGRRAAKELGVKSPLEEAGFTKNDVRQFLKNENSQLWNKPSLACYFSRFPYDVEINEGMIAMVSRSEEALHGHGLLSARVRYHFSVARVETDDADFIKLTENKELRTKAVKILKENGFQYITLDLEGYRTGSMDTHKIVNGNS